MKLGRRNFPFPAESRPAAVLTAALVNQAAGSSNKKQDLRTKFV